VLVYLLSAMPLVPGLTALLATLDRSHHVAVQQTADGLQVVLRHDCVNAPAHRHGLVARALTLIAQRPAEGHPDHVIQFAASATSQPASTFTLAPATGEPASILFPPCEFLPCVARPAARTAVRPRPPPDASGSLLSVRSIVLLI
jgi:hypothetical protein